MNPKVVNAPASVYRIGRNGDPLRFSEIRPEDAALPRAGNRYDVPGAGVLYVGDSRAACFGETIARFRPAPAMIELLGDEPDDPHFMPLGSIPQDWRLQRTIVELEIDPTARFVDVDAPETLGWLTQKLQQHLRAAGYDEPLDIADIHNKDRHLSRLIASLIFTTSNTEGDFVYDGIQYRSRVGSHWMCWAVFRGTRVTEISRASIDEFDTDLVEVAKMWNLRAH